MLIAPRAVSGFTPWGRKGQLVLAEIIIPETKGDTSLGPN
jgi:hypothetical protein